MDKMGQNEFGDWFDAESDIPVVNGRTDKGLHSGRSGRNWDRCWEKPNLDDSDKKDKS